MNGENRFSLSPHGQAIRRSPLLVKSGHAQPDVGLGPRFHRRCSIFRSAKRRFHRRCGIFRSARRCFRRRCGIFRSARRCFHRRCGILRTARRCFRRRCGIFRSARRCFHRRCGIFRTGQECGDGRCDTFGSDFLAISSIEGRFVRLLLWDFLESSWRSRGNLITASAP
jgi:hypothetical protein